MFLGGGAGGGSGGGSVGGTRSGRGTARDLCGYSLGLGFHLYLNPHPRLCFRFGRSSAVCSGVHFSFALPGLLCFPLLRLARLLRLPLLPLQFRSPHVLLFLGRPLRLSFGFRLCFRPQLFQAAFFLDAVFLFHFLQQLAADAFAFRFTVGSDDVFHNQPGGDAAQHVPASNQAGFHAGTHQLLAGSHSGV